MPPIGPLLNALNLSGSVVVTGVVVVAALAVTTANLRYQLSRRSTKLSEYLRTGEKIEKRNLLRPWRKKEVTSLRGVRGRLPRPLTKEDLKNWETITTQDAFISERLETEVGLLLGLRDGQIEGLSVELQRSRASLVDLKAKNAELDEKIDLYNKIKEGAVRLSKEASVLEARYRNIESAFKVVASIAEKAREADPRVREIIERRQQNDGKKKVKGNEVNIPVSTALRSFFRKRGRGTEGSRIFPQGRESQRGQRRGQ